MPILINKLCNTTHFGFGWVPQLFHYVSHNFPSVLVLSISPLHSLIIQGTISVGVDATDLFDRYDEDFEEMPGGGFPHIEINKMHISQSIEVQQNTHSLSTIYLPHNYIIWARVTVVSQFYQTQLSFFRLL